MSIEVILALVSFFVLIVLIMFTGMPVAFALGFIGLVLGTLVGDWHAMLGHLGQLSYSKVSSYHLSILPLFFLMGNFAFHSGIADDLYSMGYKWVGKLPGGLMSATILACAMFGGISGTSSGDAATIGRIAIHEMEKYHYKSGIAAGTVAVGGLLGPLIPPSTIMVLIGIAGEISIGKLLLAVLLPGLLIMVVLITAATFIGVARPDLCPRAPVKFTWKERFISLKGTWAAIVIFIAVIGGIFIGLFTPTEGASVGAFLTFLLLVYRKRGKDRWASIKMGILDTLWTNAMIFVIIIGSVVYNNALLQSGFTRWLVGAITGLEMPALATILGLLLIYIPLGMFLEIVAMVLITIPVFIPVAVSLGFDPIWFGVIAGVFINLAPVSPPVGLNLFVVHGVAPHIKLLDIIRGTLPYFGFHFISITLLLVFPQISLLLPRMMQG